jgi:hypothetical protein
VVEEERVDGDGDDAGEEEEVVHAVQEQVLRVVDLEGDALEDLRPMFLRRSDRLITPAAAMRTERDRILTGRLEK